MSWLEHTEHSMGAFNESLGVLYPHVHTHTVWSFTADASKAVTNVSEHMNGAVKMLSGRLVFPIRSSSGFSLHSFQHSRNSFVYSARFVGGTKAFQLAYFLRLNV